MKQKTCECGHGNVTMSENETKIVANGVLVHYNISSAITWWFLCKKCNKLLYDIDFETIKKLRTVILNTDKQKTLPRKMVVGDTNGESIERIVFAILPEKVKNGRYLAVSFEDEEDFEAGEKFEWTAWDNAEEIEETKIKQMPCKECKHRNDKAVCGKCWPHDSKFEPTEAVKPKHKIEAVTMPDGITCKDCKHYTSNNPRCDSCTPHMLLFQPTESKDYPQCKECEFECLYDCHEPCKGCKDASNFKQFKSSTGTLNGISGTWTFADNEARFKAIEKEIKKLKKKII